MSSNANEAAVLPLACCRCSRCRVRSTLRSPGSTCRISIAGGAYCLGLLPLTCVSCSMSVDADGTEIVPYDRCGSPAEGAANVAASDAAKVRRKSSCCPLSATSSGAASACASNAWLPSGERPSRRLTAGSSADNCAKAITALLSACWQNEL